MSKQREYAEFLKILAHPTRLQILQALSEGVKCVRELHELLDMRQPNVSQHLAVLKENGLVLSHKDGVLRCYHLAKPEMVQDLFALLGRAYPPPDLEELDKCREQRRKSGAAGKGGAR